MVAQANDDLSRVLAEFEEGRGLRVILPSLRVIDRVRPAYAAPHSWPGKYLSLMDEQNHEFLLVKDPEQLPAETRAAIEAEIRRRSLVATIKKIVSITEELDISYWTVVTDRGATEFVVRDIMDSARRFGDRRMVITDVANNRFEIVDTEELEDAGRRMLDRVLGVIG